MTGVQTCALRSEEHTSELQSHDNLVCRLLLEKKNPTARRRSAAPARTPARGDPHRPRALQLRRVVSSAFPPSRWRAPSFFVFFVFSLIDPPTAAPPPSPPAAPLRA